MGREENKKAAGRTMRRKYRLTEGISKSHDTIPPDLYNAGAFPANSFIGIMGVR